MDNDLDLDLGDDPNQENINNRKDNRLKDLSEKVRTANEEKDKIAKEKAEAEAREKAALKEVEFFKGFSTQASKYPGAADFQDKIKEKVMAGYDVEDATISILAKEGKLTQPSAPPPPKENPAGGSATNTIKAGGEKPINEMTRDEKRAALLEAEGRGDISLS